MTQPIPADQVPIPVTRLDEAPRGVLPYRGRLDRRVVQRDAIVHALRGVPLGKYDEAIVDWLADITDEAMAVTWCSLFERVRLAAKEES